MAHGSHRTEQIKTDSKFQNEVIEKEDKNSDVVCSCLHNRQDLCWGEYLKRQK